MAASYNDHQELLNLCKVIREGKFPDRSLVMRIQDRGRKNFYSYSPILAAMERKVKQNSNAVIKFLIEECGFRVDSTWNR